jgi:hypothetical protein
MLRADGSPGVRPTLAANHAALVLNRLGARGGADYPAGGKPLPAEVVEYIVAKTDGVPLYVEELTKMLLASALLREEADQYVLTGPLHTVAIPDTLQDALMARLDQLNTAKEVAARAVLGAGVSPMRAPGHCPAGRGHLTGRAGAVGGRRTPLSTGPAPTGQVYL